MDNSTRRELLNKAKSIGYPGNILEVFSAYDQGRDLLSEYAKEQQCDGPILKKINQSFGSFKEFKSKFEDISKL